MTKITKALVGTVAAAAVAVSSATPAMARDRDGIDVGDIIAGAVIIGGIAAVAGAIGGNNDRYGDSYGYPYDDRYGDRNGGRYGYNQGNPQQAVEQCVRTAEQQAGRYSYGRADVTNIRDINRNNRGYTVRGQIAVQSANRGWNRSVRGYDTGSFKCKVEYGRVVDLDFSGVRGLG